MTDTDSDALLLDKIGGKYGDDSDYEDIGNADEDALLADDDVLDQEPEDPDTLDLEAQDVELEDLEDKHVAASQPVTSTTVSDSDLSLINTSEAENREREDRFKSERQIASSKSHNIPDSLDNVQIVSSIPTSRNGKRGMGSFKNRGRGGNYSHRNNTQNQTVLINPHFKGHVKINNNARLAWDARQKINANNHQQVGRIMPFSQNRNQNVFQPWIHNNRPSSLSSNAPHFQQPPPLLPVYQPPIQQPQGPAWNQYQPNSFNEGPQQGGMTNNQIMVMPPAPQNMYGNQHNMQQSQFNQPPPLFGAPPYTPPPLYQNPIQNPGYCNNQFIPPPNQFRQVEPVYPSFPPMQQNQYVQDARNSQYNQMNEFNNNRVIRAKTFSHLSKNNKRKTENPEARKKKRNLPSTNLHEVHTIETPDTTMKEEKVEEEEDEYTRQYRLNIEEQKRKREKIFKLKEERRLKAIHDSESSNLKEEMEKMATPSVQQNQLSFNQQQSNLKEVRLVPKTTNIPIRIQQTITRPQAFSNNINTNAIPNNDDSNYDKQHLASFLSNRRILTKDQSLIDTSIVVISNLSAGTTDVRLRKMCQGIGDIKKLQMSPKERQATIQFNSVASAHAFFKKYQRTMLDLSMIQVTLKPIS
ncbi:hypothetical protein RI129_004499 [Pyrocoelia pectoralis]|uniref:RRM domain-containing protein n=1 Tax=Pyrocoelia pectoralis TaxID=417401 RepID=A0AAN7VCZ8_9COLE